MRSCSFKGVGVCALRNYRKDLFLLFVCIRNLIELTLESEAEKDLDHLYGIVNESFGRAAYSFLSPPLGPFHTVPLGLNRC